MPLSQSPTYNLKAVLKETGITADTLRAWERRYGVPRPQRTPGGHRLYSQRDMHLIKWLVARQAEGLSISRAVELWNELTESGTDPLAESRATGLASSQAAPAATLNMDEFRRAWLAACLEYKEAVAEQILNQAFALYSVEIVALDLIQRGLYEMGETWYRGEASVQQEHFASALATRRLEMLIAATPPPTRPLTILLACPPNEWHVFPVLLLNLLLRRRGWNTIYLGANVPMEQLEQTIQAVQPRLIVLGAQRLTTASTLRNTCDMLEQKGHPVAYGGRIFNQIPELSELIVGEFLGENIQAASERIEQLVEEQFLVPVELKAQSNRGHGQDPVAQAYHLKRSLIESSLSQRIADAGLSPNELDAANFHFTNALGAALDLGNIAYLETDLDWIRNMLAIHNVPIEGLRIYLRGFSQAAQEVMGNAAREVADWLEGYASKI